MHHRPVHCTRIELVSAAVRTPVPIRIERFAAASANGARADGFVNWTAQDGAARSGLRGRRSGIAAASSYPRVG